MYVFTLIFTIIAMEINSGQSVCSGYIRKLMIYADSSDEFCVTQISCEFNSSFLIIKWTLPENGARTIVVNVTLSTADGKQIQRIEADERTINATFRQDFTPETTYVIDISRIQSIEDENFGEFNSSKECIAPAIFLTSTPKIQTKGGSQLPLVAGLGGGGFILLVIVVIVCVILNRRRRDKAQVVTSQKTIDRGDIHHDLPHLDNAGHEFQPIGNDSIYDHMATSGRLDSNKGQETDRTSDDPTYDHTSSENLQQISTKEAPSGDVYACVNKEEKKSQLNEVEIERQIGPNGDLYTAVVMKKE